jgi:iron-regulated transporter 1
MLPHNRAVVEYDGEQHTAQEISPLVIATPQEESDRIRSVIPKARRLLYMSHLFCQFSDVSWQFSLVLFLAAFTNYESLLLVSTYGLVSGLTVCLLGSVAGRYIDYSNRLDCAQRFIWTENILVLFATVLSFLLLTRDLPESSVVHGSDDVGSSWLMSRLVGVPLDPLSVVLLVGIHVLGSAAEILSRGFLVAIERDWIVVMAKAAGNNLALTDTEQQGIEKRWLSETNVTMKQIDLSCKVCAPAIVGFVIAAFGTSSNHGKDLRGAALLVGLLNVMALIVEYICTAHIYRLITPLSVKTQVVTDDESRTATTHSSSELEEELTPGATVKFQYETSAGCGMLQLPSGLKVYMDQSIAWGGVGFSLLYLNALSFGALMTAYLLWRGMRFSTVGVWRGVSAAIGLLGTVVYHISTSYTSVEMTGMWSICFQFACLTFSYASLFVQDNMISLAMLVGGVCLSRVGLWVFDISVTQLMQEYIPAPVRGVTGGVQQSLNAFFGLLAFVLGIFFPDPKEFHIYVSAGYVAVGLGMIMYTFAIFLRRDKL